jgi:transcriptional regulator with XRE-family HTH domain
MILVRVKIMATKKIEVGPTGKTVAANIKRLRQLRRMRLDDVAHLMSFHGRAMSKATLSQIENEQRRVDVDDLVVFARVLKVNTNAILFPPRSTNETTVSLLSGFGWTPTTAVTEWSEGRTPLDPPDAPAGIDDESWATWARVDFTQASEFAEDVPNRKRATVLTWQDVEGVLPALGAVEDQPRSTYDLGLLFTDRLPDDHG